MARPPSRHRIGASRSEAVVDGGGGGRRPIDRALVAAAAVAENAEHAAAERRMINSKKIRATRVPTAHVLRRAIFSLAAARSDRAAPRSYDIDRLRGTRVPSRAARRRRQRYADAQRCETVPAAAACHRSLPEGDFVGADEIRGPINSCFSGRIEKILCAAIDA